MADENNQGQQGGDQQQGGDSSADLSALVSGENERPSLEDFERLMGGLDERAGGEQQQQTGEQGQQGQQGDQSQVQPQAQTPTPTPTPTATPPATPTPTPAPAPTPQLDETAVLRQQVLALTQQIQQLTAAKPTAQPGNTGATAQGTPQAQADPDALPNYRYQLPAQLVEDLADDDAGKRANALSFLVENLAKNIHTQVRQEFRATIEQRLQGFAQTSEQQRRDEELRNDFFKTFPHLNRPELGPIIATVTQQVIAETGATGWTNQVRDAVGARVTALVAQPSGAAMPSPTPQGAAPATSGNKPPAFVSGQSRQPAPKPLKGMEADIAETFGLA